VRGERLAHPERDRPHLGEPDLGTGVEVDPQLVGMVEVVPPHRPWVPVDHPEVRAPDEVRRVVGHELARVAARRERDRGGLQPLRRAVRDALLEERLARDPVDPALHHGRPLAQVAHDRLLALEVVVDEVELRQPALREEHLARAADAHLLVADVDDDVLALPLLILPALALGSLGHC
jgi:hypothetical protein